jgi:nucleoside-diphosphate-sugar epimerase
MTAAIAVCGAAGFIGGHLLAALASDRAASVRVLVHRHDPRTGQAAANTATVSGDLLRPESLGAFVAPGSTVVNLAYLEAASHDDNLAAATNLARACRAGGARRLVHVSTATVVGAVRDDVITEATLPDPRTDYERTKLAVERRLAKEASGALELVVLRPTAVFGPRGRNLLALAGRLATGAAPVNYVLSCLHGRRRLNLVCVDNVVAAIRFVSSLPVMGGSDTFIVSDDDDPLNNYRAVESLLAARLGRGGYPVPPLPVPAAFLAAVLRLRGRSNANPNRVYSAAKLARAGFRPPTTLAAGLESFADWYRRAEAAPAAAPA